jgi:hypothetical protein
MSQITIEGLTVRQRVFADILWNCRGREQVNAFIQALPSQFQAEARTVVEMMVAACFDGITNTTDAQRILKGF